MCRNTVAVLLFLVFPNMYLYSEGTKQIKPTTSAHGQLCINRWRNEFGFYNGSPEFRLNISVSNVSEKVRFGFGQVLGTTTTDLVYRIKDPSNTVVWGPFPVPSSGVGYINTYDEAVNGPFVGGYSYLELAPLTTGNYYLEFYYPPVSGSYSDGDRHNLEFFDITVVNATGNAINGRVWSKAWQFWSDSPDSNIDRFYGKMMILSDDSIVTQVDCNGYIGGTFSFASNITGCATTGNLVNDRMSRAGFHTYPQYKVFLNDPDSILFPTQKMSSAIIQPILVDVDCSGQVTFKIKVVKDCTIKIVIEINPNPGADAEDVQIIADVKANPGGTGYNLIPWNGIDNNGNAVVNGTSLAFTVSNLSGLTHLPIYDIETNEDGFIVKQIRPKGGQLRIFWDDSQIGGGVSNTTTGCLDAGGCHTWTNSFGNEKTINSWWFVSWAEIPGNIFVTKKFPGILTISGNSMHCIGPGSEVFSINNDPNATSYSWSYSGNGATITVSGTTATVNFAANATPGILSVYGNNVDCGDGPISSLNITFEPKPVVSLLPYPDICFTAPGFLLTGGNPTGGNYTVDGMLADSLFPYRDSEGLHSIIYTYASPIGCTSSDTTEILLRDGPDCKGHLYFPTAFTPNNDGANEVFLPASQNIANFRMYIYDRWGQLIYTTNNLTKGWDGKFNGVDCSLGLYVYRATYSLSLRTNDIETKRGSFELIR